MCGWLWGLGDGGRFVRQVFYQWKSCDRAARLGLMFASGVMCVT
jgi:hypothetical protein